MGIFTRFFRIPNLTKFFLAVLIFQSCAPFLVAQAPLHGQWQTLPYLMPINPIHVALMHNGKVLVVAGSGNDANHFAANDFKAAVWDPSAGTVAVQSVTWDMFCNGITILPDGRPFVVGGNKQYTPFQGLNRASIFDPTNNTFSDVQNMAHGRWYPTATTLGDGRVMVFSGLDEGTGTNGGLTNKAVEFYTVGSGWSREFIAQFTPPLYPRLHVLPNGTVFDSGSAPVSRFFNPANQSWTTGPSTNFGSTRTYGSSVLLALTPANNYAPRVVLFGGGGSAGAGSPATATTEIIDLSVPNPQWRFSAPMMQARMEMNAVMLPNGKILAIGGSADDEDGATAGLTAEIFDPATETFSSAGTEAFARLYHSVGLLMPDATVWVAGSNPPSTSFEKHMEIYSPPYLFASDGSRAPRPSIDGAPSEINYGGSFTVQTSDAASISSVVLIRAGAPTHAFDMDQRLVGLSFTAGQGQLSADVPSNPNIAPPGYYLLFILNQAGTPSVAKFVHVSGSADKPPSGTITSPAGDVSIQVGQSVTFAGSGTDPDGTIAHYNWVFPGGTPAQSNQQNPGAVTYSTPGTFVATLNVVDNAGTHDPSPPTRKITVVPSPDFTLTAAAGADGAAVKAGSVFKGVVGVVPQGGFTGTVNLSCPPNTCTLSSSSVNLNGSPVTVTVTAITTVDEHDDRQITITATDGTKTKTITLHFTVTNYSLTSVPGHGSAGGIGTIVFTVAPLKGYTGKISVQCDASAVSSHATCTLSPASPVSIGANSVAVTASIAVPSGVAPGNYTIQLSTADTTSATLTHTASQTLSVSDLGVSASPGTLQVAAGQSAKTTITTSMSGAAAQSTHTVSFACSGLPALATCAFNPAKVTTSGSTAASTTLTISTTAGSVASLRNRQVSFYALWLPLPGMFLGLLQFGRRSSWRKRIGYGLLTLTLALLMFGLGCAGVGNKSPSTNSSPGTPAGTYTVAVTGTSEQQTQGTTNLTLTVTK